MRDVLLPAQRQALWKTPAVANFVLGGTGAGLYLVAAVAAAFAPSPATSVAAWLAPALVAAGFGALTAEAGRPLRGLRVLRRVRTSWMSRELALGGAFIVLAVVDGLAPALALRILAVTAAAGLAIAQGGILRAARGVPAWNVAAMPAVFASSAALSGAGVFLLLDVFSGRAPDSSVLGVTLPLLPVGLVVWLHYLTGSDDAAFAAAVAPLRRGATATSILGLGYVLPLLAGLAALAVPAFVDALAAATGALMIAGQMRAKSALLREVAVLRAITFPLRGARTHPWRSI